jgi:protein-disulfide isomerase
MDIVDADISDGNRAGILATPSAYVNGRQLDDLSPEGLKAAIEEALKRGA